MNCTWGCSLVFVSSPPFSGLQLSVWEVFFSTTVGWWVSPLSASSPLLSASSLLLSASSPPLIAPIISILLSRNSPSSKPRAASSLVSFMSFFCLFVCLFVCLFCWRHSGLGRDVVSRDCPGLDKGNENAGGMFYMSYPCSQVPARPLPGPCQAPARLLPADQEKRLCVLRVCI